MPRLYTFLLVHYYIKIAGRCKCDLAIFSRAIKKRPRRLWIAFTCGDSATTTTPKSVGYSCFAPIVTSAL